MWVKVLKSFPYAHDGMHTVQLAEGAAVQIHDDLVPALHRDGYIEEAEEGEIDAAGEGPVVLAPPLDIPDDWETLHWFKQRALAAQLNEGVAPKDKLAAQALIQAELTRRAGA